MLLFRFTFVGKILVRYGNPLVDKEWVWKAIHATAVVVGTVTLLFCILFCLFSPPIYSFLLVVIFGVVGAAILDVGEICDAYWKDERIVEIRPPGTTWGGNNRKHQWRFVYPNA